VCERRQAESALWAPVLNRHIELFGAAPRLAVAEGSEANESAAHARGVRQVVLPRQPRETRSRRHGLRRCRSRGESGMGRWESLTVIANNLLVLGRAAP